MKRTAMQHTKLKRLVRVLQVPQYAAVGILESLWHLTARETPTGNIGRLTNEDIADWIGWDGEPEFLIGSLITAGWIDENEVDRLVIHDWLEHADDATRKQLERKGLIDGKDPGASVYFIRGMANGLIKIGFTEGSVAARLKQLQVGSAEKLEMIGSIKGNRNTEMDLHKQFAGCRTNGEWFAPTPDLLRHIASATGKHCPPLSAVVSPPEPLPEPLPVPEPVPKDKQKISRAKKLREARNKPPCKTDLAKVRHKEFKAAIGLYWKSKNPGVEMPWGAPEGQALEIWLRESPNTSIDQFTGFLRHRFKSEANHTERPSVWIRNVTSYAVEPLDKYGKPQSIGGTHAKPTANSRFDRSQASTARVLSDLLGPDLDLAADSGGRTLEAGS